jgi:hypothetical protein
VTGLAAGGTRPSLTERVERLVGTRGGHDHWTRSSRRLAVRLLLTAAAFALAWYGPRARLPAAEAVVEFPGEEANPRLSSGRADRPELDALDAELQSLESQMQRVSDLLGRVRLSADEEQIARRLRQRAESIARRRAELAARGPAWP